jgi:hypothetical protein
MDQIHGKPLPARTAMLKSTDTIGKIHMGIEPTIVINGRCPQGTVQGQPLSKAGASGVSFGSACSGLS